MPTVIMLLIFIFIIFTVIINTIEKKNIYIYIAYKLQTLYYLKQKF